MAELLGGAPADEPCGIVLADAQPETVARALARIVDDPDAAHAMGATAQQRVEREITWEKTAQAARVACERAQTPVTR